MMPAIIILLAGFICALAALSGSARRKPLGRVADAGGTDGVPVLFGDTAPGHHHDIGSCHGAVSGSFGGDCGDGGGGSH